MVLILAHRGFSGMYPENTILAFEKAFEIGADGIELDVHASKDGQLVIMHDNKVERTTNGKGLIGTMTWSEIQELDAGQGEHVPLLEDVISLCKQHDKFLNIEVKGLGIQEKIVELLHKYDFIDNVLVSSFMHVQLPPFKKLDPRIKIAILIAKVSPRILTSTIAKFTGADAINPEYTTCTDKFLKTARKKNYTVYPWTCDDVDFAKKLALAGVAGIITNRPDLMIEAGIRDLH